MAQKLLNEWNHIVYFSDLMSKPNQMSSVSLFIVRICWETLASLVETVSWHHNQATTDQLSWDESTSIMLATFESALN